MSRTRGSFNAAVTAVSSLGDKRFGLLVASSLVATTAIVASALMTGTGDSGAAAALLTRAAAQPAATVAPEPAPSPPAEASGPSASAAEASVLPEASAPASEALAPAPEEKPASTPEEAAPPTETLPEAGRVKHVFVISLASSGYEAAFGEAPQMPYLATTLRPQGELLSGYSLLTSAGLPNEIAAISGQPPNPQTEANCPVFDEFPPNASVDKKGVVAGAGCVHPVEVLTVADQLVGGRFRWGAYVEGMADETGKPDNCVHPEFGGPDEPVQGGYAARRNPFVYFHSLLDVGDCTENDHPLTELDRALRKIDSTPNFVQIVPNLCNAGVTGQCPAEAPGGAASADAFLAQWVPKILASPAYEKDGLLIVTFDELNPPDPVTGAPAPGGKPLVGALLVSRFVAPGATDPAPYDPYSLLRSVEDLFGLDHLGLAAREKTRSFVEEIVGETRGD